jgi:hypothetical protein
VRVEIFFKIAALDIPTPLTSALDGDSAIFPTAVTVDFPTAVSFGWHLARRVEYARQAAHMLWMVHVPLGCENATLMVGTASHGAVC